jgi:hypothetical protein
MSKALLKSKNILGIAEGGTGATSMGAGAVGAVSQAAGIPTGAIVESGSNANGTFTKYADGTMICVRTYTVTGVNVTNATGSLFYVTWTAQTFAATFIAPPVVHNGAYVSGASIWATNGSSTATSTGAFLVMAPNSISNAAITVHITAIGRWF